MAQNRLEKGLPMRKITVNKVELLKKLEENRVKHIENYKQAVVEYKSACLADLEDKKNVVVKALDSLKKKIEASNKPVNMNVDENLYFDLQPPVSHEKEYDEIIEVFRMEVNDNVELDSIEFHQYVSDNWEWKNELENQRTFYASKSVGMAK